MLGVTVLALASLWFDRCSGEASQPNATDLACGIGNNGQEFGRNAREQVVLPGVLRVILPGQSSTQLELFTDKPPKITGHTGSDRGSTASSNGLVFSDGAKIVITYDQGQTASGDPTTFEAVATCVLPPLTAGLAAEPSSARTGSNGPTLRW